MQKKIQQIFANIFSKYCPRLRITLLVMLAGVFLLPQVAFLSTITEENIINLTNNERAKEGLGPVTASQLLAKAAHDKARDIVAAGTFDHNINGRKFSAWIKDAGYSYTYVGENLAMDFITSEGAMRAWMDSPTHRRNILNGRFREIGVAVMNAELNGENTVLVVQVFGEPLQTTIAGPIAGQKTKAAAKGPAAAPASANRQTTAAIHGSSGADRSSSHIWHLWLLSMGVLLLSISLIEVDRLKNNLTTLSNHISSKNKQLKLPLK